MDSASKIINFHQKNHIPRDLIPLSENGYNEYMKLYSDFMAKTMILLEKEEKMEKITRPYLAFNMILPIKNLVEFRLNKVNK